MLGTNTQLRFQEYNSWHELSKNHNKGINSLPSVITQLLFINTTIKTEKGSMKKHRFKDHKHNSLEKSDIRICMA